MAKLYPAFSRRATQVCILSAALEKIEAGCADPHHGLVELGQPSWGQGLGQPKATLSGNSPAGLTAPADYKFQQFAQAKTPSIRCSH
jgi:hypothetical protein